MSTIMDSLRRSLARLAAYFRRKGTPGWAIYLGLLFLIVVGGVLSPHFLRSRNIFNVLRQATPLFIVAIGQTYLILSGGIDLSVGSVISLTSSVACMMMLRGDQWTIPAVIVALGIGAGVGFVNGLIVNTRRVPSFVVTLGMMTVVQGLTLIVTGGYPKGRASSQLLYIGEGYLGPIPLLFLVAVVVVAIGWVFMTKTVFGRYTYAVGANPQAANLSGIHITRHSIKIFTLCGFTAGLAGLALAARVGVGDPFVGNGFELDSIASVVMGGTALSGGIGGIPGTVVGVLLIATINNLLNLLSVSGFYQHVIKGFVIIVAVSLYKGRE